jgi:hypothetical protein
MPDGYAGSPSNVPIPDPSDRTTIEMLRAVRAERDYVDGQLAVRDERFEGIARATVLLNSQMTAVPSETDKAIQHLQSLHEGLIISVEKVAAERFISIQKQLSERDKEFAERDKVHEGMVSSLAQVTAEQLKTVALQFKERDTRSERESRDNKVAVDAAFAAQKEAASEQNKSNTLAISKSEASTSETINKLSEAGVASTKALSDKIDDVKTRITATEQQIQNLPNRDALDARISAVIATVDSIRKVTEERATVMYAQLQEMAGRTAGASESRNVQRQEGQYSVAIIAGAIAFISLTVAVITLIVKFHTGG